mgnify:FL=1
MKMVGLEQSHQLMSVLACNSDWSQISPETAQRIIDDPTGSGLEFTRFLANGGRITVQSSILPIPRAIPFNPAEFLGSGWSIWKGPADGDGLSGEEEQDERSLAITELDLSRVQLVTCLNEGEECITGEERLKRLKENNFIRLDASIFLTLWQNQHFIPGVWKKTNTTFIFFEGTILRSPGGARCVLCLFWDGSEWFWLYFHWLEDVWSVSNPSAVLAS